MFNWLSKLGGDASEREIKKIRPLIDEINALEAEYKALSDDALRDKTTEFRGRLLATARPRRSAARGVRRRARSGAPHHRQAASTTCSCIAGAVLHSGRIAEMRTGEGKTLVGHHCRCTSTRSKTRAPTW